MYALAGTRTFREPACAVAARPKACTLPLSQRKFTQESAAPMANPALPRHPQRHPAHAAPAPPSASVSHSTRRSAALPNGSPPIFFFPRGLFSRGAFSREPPDHFKHSAGKSKHAQEQSQNRRSAQPLVEQITESRADHHASDQHKRQVHHVGELPGKSLRIATRRRRRLRIWIFIGQRVRTARLTNKLPSG